MTLRVIEFPDRDIRDVSSALRVLADAIEKGEYGDAHNLAWVIDCGEGRIEAGLLGPAAEVAPTAYFLFGLAQRRIEP